MSSESHKRTLRGKPEVSIVVMHYRQAMPAVFALHKAMTG
jgi:hypothetical protein